MHPVRFSERRAIGDGELSGSSSRKIVSHMVTMNAVFLTESLNIVVAILRDFSDRNYVFLGSSFPMTARRAIIKICGSSQPK
jgi:hypothetical protein